MKSTITKLKSLVLTGVLLGGFLSTVSLKAQCPTQCTGTNSWGCGGALVGNGTDYPGDILAVDVADAKGSSLASYSGLGCTSYTASNTYKGVLNQGKPFDLTAGESISVTVDGGSWATYSWGTRVGIWIDADRNGQFTQAECLVDPANNVASGKVTYNLKMPCWKTTGCSFLRIRGGASVYTMANSWGCNTQNTYGNVLDLEVNLKLGATPVANFTVPSSNNFVNSLVKFNAINPSNGYTYKWTFDKAANPPYTGYNANTAKGAAKWMSTSNGGPGAGKYDVKLHVSYCGIADSITKQVTIVAPSLAPKADFIASDNEVEVYFDVQMFDLSNNGAYKWNWELTSPTGIDDQTSNDQNPIFNLQETGWYSVCLTSENDIGKSNKVCKNRYVECISPTEYIMGPQTNSQARSGTIYDHAYTNDYSNNRKRTIDYFKIVPCGAEKITLTFAQLKLQDAGDKLRIYDFDEENPAKLVATIDGSNYTKYDTTAIVLNSGVGYLTFESNGSGVAAGYIINWDAKLKPAVKPEADWSLEYNPVAVGTTVTFKNNTKNAQGIPEYEWNVLDDAFNDVDGPFSATDLTYSGFYTDGDYYMMLIARTCTGVDTFMKKYGVFTPTSAGDLDYTASNLRPNVNDVVSITTKTNYANDFEWSIFPTTFTYEDGTDKNSQNPKIKFTKGGAYTFTLTASNRAAEAVTAGSSVKKVIKNKYVIVLDYCVPLVDIQSSDVGINKVVLSKDSKTLLSNESEAGVDAYNDFSDDADLVKPTLTFGASYDLEVSRNTISNEVNFKAWIDFNIDGDFNDAGEEVLTSGKISTASSTAKFTVPNLSSSFEGTTRLRVGVAYSDFSNTPCGVNTVGEFEDYAIILANDNLPPTITLIGADTMRVEKAATKTACYAEVAGTSYKASDPTEGDMTSKVKVKTDLDCTAPGIYTFEFNLEDASGNKAVTRTRTVIVALDKTAPVLTLNGNDTLVLEQCDTYNESGAVAIDANDGNLTSAIKIDGKVLDNVVGDYLLTYSVKDAQSNSASVKRLVQVRDTKAPSIKMLNDDIVDGTTIDVQIGSVFVDQVYAVDPCNGGITVNKTPGFKGPVNTNERGTYAITYTSADPSGNKAVQNGFVINYRVDDYIAPEINLNTSDTVIHDVNDAYFSRSVTVTDNYYDKSQVSVTKVGKVDPFKLGTYVETYTATDASGNSITKQRFVKVVDRVAPTVTAPPVSACIGQPFWAMSGLILRDNYYASGDLAPLVKVLGHNVNIYEAGVYFINYSLTDPSGNEAIIVSRTVYVQYPPNCINTYLETKEVSLENSISIYPNSSTGLFNLAIAITNEKPVSVQVTNAMGAVVSTLSNVSANGVTELNLSNVAPGIYNVTFTNNGEVATKRVVVTR